MELILIYNLLAFILKIQIHKIVYIDNFLGYNKAITILSVIIYPGYAFNLLDYFIRTKI